jgi:hypothetical protein
MPLVVRSVVLTVRPSLPVYLDIAGYDVEHRHVCFPPNIIRI